MSDVERIVLTAIATIIGGVIVYFFGHLSVALFVEPIHRLRSFIGEIADSLIFMQMSIVIPRCFLRAKKMRLKKCLGVRLAS